MPLTIIAAVITLFLLRLHRWRTARLPQNPDNNLPEDSRGDKPELEGNRGMVTQKPELEANEREVRNIPRADTTTTELPAIPPDQNTSVCLGQQHLGNTERRTPGSDAAADNTMPARELEARNIPRADTTATELPAILPDQNTSVCLGQQHLGNTQRRTPGSDAAADNTMPAHELEDTRSLDPQTQMIERNPEPVEI